EADGDVDRLHQLGGFFGKAPTPHGLSLGRGRGFGRRLGHMKIVRTSVAVLSAAGLLYVIGCAPSTPTKMTRLRKGGLALLKVPGEMNPKNPKYPDAPVAQEPAAAPAPDQAITAPDGGPVKLADFKGKVLVVNLWATWCAPCKVEMPTLAALQKAYDGR